MVPRPIVLDSSVAVAWLLGDEPAHVPATRLRRQIERGVLEPSVAGHFGFEVRSALMQAARRERIGWDVVPQLVAAIDAMVMAAHPFTRADDVLLSLCRRHGLTWADAHWVELAARLDAPLATADRALVRHVPDDVALLVDVSSGPA